MENYKKDNNMKKTIYLLIVGLLTTLNVAAQFAPEVTAADVPKINVLGVWGGDY